MTLTEICPDCGLPTKEFRGRMASPGELLGRELVKHFRECYQRIARLEKRVAHLEAQTEAEDEPIDPTELAETSKGVTV